MIKRILSFCFVLVSLTSTAQVDVDLEYYLKPGYSYNPDIPTPESVLGFQIGEWHVSHDQIYMYMKELAEASERVKLEVIGRTYEQRPLMMLTISHPDNLAKLNAIKFQRSQLRDPAESRNVAIENMPAVVYMGYSVHGNEPSGVNASLLAAYHFAAANEVEDDLKNIVIIMEPGINPDGINRFASWVNSNRSIHMNGDPMNRELNEAWPRGRTNHYWFDLNRDWLPVQHPESRSRIAKIQEWKPNLVLDFHEMGTNSTFFFQPGIPSRNHPLTPRKNFELTEKIAQYHAKYLDEIGSLYFTQENYDDFYYGKGSTYPDVQGQVGILFEQASSRGHLQESVNGPLSFAFTIRNQFTASLSSFEAAVAMRQELNNYMRDFYLDAKKDADADINKAYIFGVNEDIGRTYHLADMILQHEIKLYGLKEDITINGTNFKANKAFIVPLNQPQYRLIKGMFETRTEFQDSLFYDVSAWTLPMAFDMQFMTLNSKILNLANVEEIQKGLSKPKGKVNGAAGAYGYAFEWSEYYAPKAAYELMKKGYNVRVSHEPFEINSELKFSRGTILVDKGRTKASNQEFFEDLQAIAQETGITIQSVDTGYTRGINMGSPSIDVLEIPEVALLVDNGVSSSEAGEIWHLLDQRFEMPITLLPTENFNYADLGRYNVIIFPNGSYSDISASGVEALSNWVRDGGTVIARGRALNWLNQNKIGKFTFKTNTEEDSTLQKSYADLSNDQGAKVTGGAIFNVKLDLTHPLGYGYSHQELYTFRNSNQFMEPSENPFANPLVYTDKPLASGYVYPFNLEQMKNTAMIRVSAHGRGKVIGFVDNPNFRAFWFGTNKLFLNGIFFGQTISGSSAR
ncbi:zinc carboxypeptidase [Echinicola sp. CAU 1574]|uniref:Zinc carboxypeptidase n=1 Tax=Echinicola arenosa TaxID=2774144 RepID=A0ABR9ALM7_9BACT|nr:M14 metallopeptidase family protein [Echinicola arenosa]MBD8489706.1 zinc carboxypeptidase [Echinicola arenosa]